MPAAAEPEGYIPSWPGQPVTQGAGRAGFLQLRAVSGNVLVVGFLLAVELPKGLFPGSSSGLAVSRLSLGGYLFHFSAPLLST